MSTWVIGVLLLLVAVPLVFMGLGNYQSSEESYAFKINDQIISTSQLEQEVFQYRQALEKNYQGNLPPLYTNSFIREVTVDYMFRTILLDQASRDTGLVFHNESILNTIYSTSSFRDENGFNKEKYLSQLYRIGMNANSYERYIYQKGITGQLQNSITNTAFLTKNEKDDLIKFRHHERDISYIIVDYNDIKENIVLNEQDLKEEYENNLDVYRSPAYAKYLYLDIDKNDLGSSINDSIKEITKEIQSSGGFNIDDYLNQDFTITLNNYSQLVGSSLGIDINDFKDLTKVANDFYGSNMTSEDYANHWQSAQYMDSTSNWGDVTLGVDLIDQMGSFDAASIAKDLGTDLQTVADSISQAATIGVSTDLEAAAQGLGYDSFADAVAAYNAKYGTNYTTDSAREALGQ